MRNLNDPGVFSRLENVYRRSSLSKRAAKDILIKPVIQRLIRWAEIISSFDTSPIEYLPKRIAMLTGSADSHLIDMVSLFLTKGSVFWDVGANIGYITRRLGKARRNAVRSYAFEPNPELFAVLSGNLRPVRSARPIQVALGAADGETTLFVGDYCEMASASKDWATNCDKQAAKVREHVVSVRSGDSLIRSGELMAPEVMKIDVEGYELAVLEGLRDHIATARNLAVVCEFNPRAMEKARYEPLDLFRMLWDAGFRVWHIDESRRACALSAIDEAKRLREHVDGDYANIFAIKGHDRVVDSW